MLPVTRSLAAAALAAFAAAATAGPGYWSGNGPWGGVAYGIHVPPGPTGITTAFASTRGGLYRTLDGGLSWTAADVGIPGGLLAAPLAIDDVDPNRLWAVGLRNRVYRSTDNGDSWIETYALPPNLSAVALADVPGDSTTVYLAARGDASAGVRLLKSVDGGASFAPVGGGLPDEDWAVIAVHPTDPDIVLVGAEASNDVVGTAPVPRVWRSGDGGATWSVAFSQEPFGSYVPPVEDIAWGGGSEVYLAAGQLHRSTDDGVTWGPPQSSLGRLLPDPTTPSRLLMGGYAGVHLSVDAGATTTPMNTGLTSNPTYVSDLPPFNWLPATVMDIAAASTWPAPGTAVWVATDGGGVFRSVDGGNSWSSANFGLGAVNARAVAVHPGASTAAPGSPGTRIYAGFGDAFRGSPGVFLSTNFGGAWNAANTGLEASQIRALAIDPTTAGSVASTHVYAGGGPALLQGFANGGLYKSINGGVSWTTIDGGIPNSEQLGGTAPYIGTVRAIVLDPRSCTLPIAVGAPPCASGPLLRLYATSTGNLHQDPPGSGLRVASHRVMRSDDAGASWTALDATLPPSTRGGAPDFLAQDVTPLDIVLSTSDPDVLYVGTFASLNGPAGAVFEDRPSGVFRSDDGGATWVQRSAGLPRLAGYSNIVYAVLALAIHPLDHDVLWASAYDTQTGIPASSPLWKTTDGGLSWTASATGLPAGIDIREIIVDPGDPDIVYVSGYYPAGDDGSGSFSNPPGVFRSDDGGATWLSISGGLTARAVLAMALDPFQPQVLHLGTDTGVWTMEQLPDADGDGAPDVLENLAPNFGDGDGDGEPDALQGAVGSTIVIFGRPEAAKGAQAGVTTRLSPVEGECSQKVDVQALLAARYGRDYLPGGLRYFRYPRDLVRFEVLDCKVAQVDLIFHGANFLAGKGWSFRMYGPSTPGDDATVGWHDLSARAQVIAPNRWRLLLDRDEMGSYRSSGTSILFMGGPACHDARIFEDRFGDGVAAGCND